MKKPRVQTHSDEELQQIPDHERFKSITTYYTMLRMDRGLSGNLKQLPYTSLLRSNINDNGKGVCVTYHKCHFIPGESDELFILYAISLGTSFDVEINTMEIISENSTVTVDGPKESVRAWTTRLVGVQLGHTGIIGVIC